MALFATPPALAFLFFLGDSAFHPVYLASQLLYGLHEQGDRVWGRYSHLVVLIPFKGVHLRAGWGSVSFHLDEFIAVSYSFFHSERSSSQEVLLKWG